MRADLRTHPHILCPLVEEGPADPWSPPKDASSAMLGLHDESEPRLGTAVYLWRSENALFVLFDLEDERETAATLIDHDSEIWREDVVEVFLAPRSPDEYFELEVSPLATRFSARISSPDLDRSTMKVDMGWNPSSYEALVRRDSGTPWRARVRISISFHDLGVSPTRGDQWRGNFYRIDRSRDGDEFSAWSATGEGTPDFHRPRKFGIIEIA